MAALNQQPRLVLHTTAGLLPAALVYKALLWESALLVDWLNMVNLVQVSSQVPVAVAAAALNQAPEVSHNNNQGNKAALSGLKVALALPVVVAAHNNNSNRTEVMVFRLPDISHKRNTEDTTEHRRTQAAKQGRSEV